MIVRLLDEDGGHDPDGDIEANKLHVRSISGGTAVAGQFMGEHSVIVTRAIEVVTEQVRSGGSRPTSRPIRRSRCRVMRRCGPWRSKSCAAAAWPVTSNRRSRRWPKRSWSSRADDPFQDVSSLDGVRLPDATTRTLRCAAELTALIVDSLGVPLAMGRKIRLATDSINARPSRSETVAAPSRAAPRRCGGVTPTTCPTGTTTVRPTWTRWRCCVGGITARPPHRLDDRHRPTTNGSGSATPTDRSSGANATAEPDPTTPTPTPTPPTPEAPNRPTSERSNDRRSTGLSCRDGSARGASAHRSAPRHLGRAVAQRRRPAEAEALLEHGEDRVGQPRASALRVEGAHPGGV